MYFEYIERLFSTFKNLEISDNQGNSLDYEVGMQCAINLFVQTQRLGKKVFFVGNGGSAAIASHMTADFFKNGHIRTHGVFDSSLLTCISNDFAYEQIFSFQIDKMGEAKDLLVAISSSGSSSNILSAANSAMNIGLDLITFTGFAYDNALRKMGTYNFYVPLSSYGIVESIHTIILQQIVDEISEMQ